MTIKKRHVFYLSGYDPRGASFYHRVFREESAKQSQLNGISMNIGGRKKWSSHSQGWKIEAVDGDIDVTTQYEFLCWDDIIRKNWVKSFYSIFLDFIYVSWVYITTGTLKRVAKASRTPAITGLYPALYIAVFGLLAALLLFLSIKLFSAFGLVWLGYVLGIASAVLLIFLAKLWGDKINVFWLLRIYAFTSRWAAGRQAEIDKRIDVFADRVVEVMTSDQQDEVVIIGHSVGSMLLVALAARIVDLIDQKQVNSPVNMLSLGECVPLLSLLPKATAIKQDLSRLSCARQVLWVDYTSPADGACFPLVDPVKVSLPSAKYCKGPILLSTRFYKLFSDDYYQSIRRNFYQMHFLYLMANHQIGQYDFFAMVAGKQSLSERIQQQYDNIKIDSEREYS